VRWRGHDPSDTAPYRPKEELETWDLHDPVRIAGKQALDRKLLSEADIERLKAEIKKKIAQAVEWGLAQPLPVRADYLAEVSGKF
jgi:TPP-dependent pyruvate/acetoin dehydrogenase alpha subunit